MKKPLTDKLPSKINHIYMGLALNLAQQAAISGEVPVGAIIVKNNCIVGRGANRREHDQDPLAHAEIIAIAEAAENIGFWRLDDTTLYVTLEPCPMCAGAIINARIPNVVFGANDPKSGAAGSIYNILEDNRLNHRCNVTKGVRIEESATMLSSFFQKLRSSKKRS